VHQPLLLVELLLTGGEGELLAALAACERLVFVHGNWTSSGAPIATPL
jgi:hypothetical protein